MYLDTRMLIESAFSQNFSNGFTSRYLSTAASSAVTPVEPAPPRRPGAAGFAGLNVLCVLNNRHLPCDSGRPDCYLQIYIICEQQ